MHFKHLASLVFLTFGPMACLAETGVFGFVDARGELFLSNVPDDDRYRRVDTAKLFEAEIGASPVAQVKRQRAYDLIVARVAHESGLESALLHAVISVESGYNAKAVSRRGASGLMQLMPETAKRFGVVDAFDPADNVRAGAQYLHALLTLFDNDIPLALAAYNAGEAAVIKYGRRIPPYRETTAYVPRVVRIYEGFRIHM